MCLECNTDQRLEEKMKFDKPLNVALSVGINGGKVFIGFGGQPVTHLGLSPRDAIQFGRSMIAVATELALIESETLNSLER